MTGRWRAAIIICSILGLVGLLTARALGPGDLWDQTQPKTVSYTTDIIVHGGLHWLLPIERGELPATKPPLYNWLAVPAVRVLGFDSEIAHKLPSFLALLLCWLIIVRLGRSLDDRAGGDQSLGWLAGLIFVANYSTFKLGYLARPDMLLTLWLLIAWWSATRLFADARPAPRSSIAIVFWLAVALAGLTKGPAALVAVAYAILAARIVSGRWSSIRTLRPIIGMVAVTIVCGAWVFAVWKIDPAHVQHELWFNEIWGRITGRGAEGTDHGTKQWLHELPYQGAYYMARFTPWSFITLIALYPLFRLRKATDDSAILRRWIVGAALFAMVTVGLFTLSTGKRADYIAVAFPQASLLAAWWLLRSRLRIAVRLPWLVPAAAAVVLSVCAWREFGEPTAPAPGFGDAIMRFARQSNAAIAADPAPVFTVGAGQTHLQAMMGIAAGDSRHDMLDIIARSQADGFWVVAGRLQNPPHEFDRWLAQQRRLNAEATAVVQSPRFPLDAGWQEQVTLWRVRSRSAPSQP